MGVFGQRCKVELDSDLTVLISEIVRDTSFAAGASETCVLVLRFSQQFG